MNLGKLSKRLRKELLAHPKQAVVLAIVCLVAGWFWWPLLTKGSKGKGKVPAATVEPAAAEATAVAKVEPQRPWFDIQRWRQADPLTRSATLADDARDPFQVPIPIAVGRQEDGQEQTEPDKLGPAQPALPRLALEAIVYSDSLRVAQINGLTVKEDEELVINGDEDREDDGGRVNAATRLTARVVAIRPTEVLLEIGGQSLKLSLASKTLGRGEVVKRLQTQ